MPVSGRRQVRNMIAMGAKLILIAHAADETDDRASAWASRIGFALQWCFPFEGPKIPDLDEHVAGTIVHGGRFDVNPKHAWPFLRDQARWIET